MRWEARSAWMTAVAATYVVAAIALNVYLALKPNAPYAFDFDKAYYLAGKAILTDGPPGIRPLVENVKFVNWPIVAYFFVPLAEFPRSQAEFLFGFLGVITTAVVILNLSANTSRKTRIRILSLFLMNGPLWDSIYAMGNTTHFMLALILIAWSLLQRGLMFSAGTVIGVACVFKPMLTIFALYFLWRRNWRAVAGILGLTSAAALASVAIFGLDLTQSWFEHCIVEFARRPIAAYNNQSVNAFLIRLWTGPAYIFDWKGHDFPFGLAMISKISMVSLLALILVTSWRRRLTLDGVATEQHRVQADWYDLSMILTFCVIASPVSWTHYYLLLLIPWSLVITRRIRLTESWQIKVPMWTSIVICSMPVRWPFQGSHLLAEVLSRTAISAWLFGALMLLWALVRSERQDGSEAGLRSQPDTPGIIHGGG